MKIFLDQTHLPYSFDLCRALNGCGEIYHGTWCSTALRPRLPFVKVILKDEALATHWDVFITDDMSPVRRPKAAKSILILHLERHAPVTDRLRRMINRFDFVVTISENKTSTWMSLITDRFITIPLAINGDDYKLPADYCSTIVGTAMNAIPLRTGCIENWKALTESIGFRTRVIGDLNRDVPADEVIGHSMWDGYKKALSGIGVFVHIVEGNETGMSVREAMASGIPVVSGITPELYYFAYDGWDISMVRGPASQNYGELRRRIKVLCSDAGLRAQMGTAGRNSVLRAYPMSRFVEQWKSLVK